MNTANAIVDNLTPLGQIFLLENKIFPLTIKGWGCDPDIGTGPLTILITWINPATKRADGRYAYRLRHTFVF